MKLFKKLFLMGVASLIFIANLFAQAPDTLWTKTFGGTNEEWGQSIKQTIDGGYIIAGYTKSFGAGSADVYLIKTNANGDTIWTKTYGGMFEDYGASVQQTFDSGYIIVGFTYSFSAGSYDIYLIKTNTSGDIVWTKTYGGISSDYGFSVQQTSDSGYIIVGYTESYGAGNGDVYLIKTNTSGDTVWTKTYGATFWDGGYSVLQTTDYGYVITGSTESYGVGGHDVYLIKTNSNGDTLWTKTYGGINSDRGSSILQTYDGEYIVVGFTETSGSTDIYLIKTNENGDSLWTKTYGGTHYDWGNSILQLSDSGYVIAGYTNSYGEPYGDVFLMRVNENGDVIWEKTYGGGSYDEAWSVDLTTDGGYIIAGYTKSFGAGNYDVYLIKTEPDVGVEEKQDLRPKTTDMKLTASPNPFTSSTTIHLKGAQAHKNTKAQEIEIFDISGRKIRSLMPCDGCSGALVWDGRDAEGKKVNAGIYFLKLDDKPAGKVMKVR